MKQGVRRPRPRRRFPRSFPSWKRWPQRLRLVFHRPSGAGGIGSDEPADRQSSSGVVVPCVCGARGVQRHGGRARPRRPWVHRVEVMASNAYGGLASGFHQVQAVNPTAGLRVKLWRRGAGGAKCSAITALDVRRRAAAGPRRKSPRLRWRARTIALPAREPGAARGGRRFPPAPTRPSACRGG